MPDYENQFNLNIVSSPQIKEMLNLEVSGSPELA
jgi:hypothetical protein